MTATPKRPRPDVRFVLHTDKGSGGVGDDYFIDAACSAIIAGASARGAALARQIIHLDADDVTTASTAAAAAEAFAQAITEGTTTP